MPRTAGIQRVLRYVKIDVSGVLGGAEGSMFYAVAESHYMFYTGATVRMFCVHRSASAKIVRRSVISIDVRMPVAQNGCL